MVNITEINCEIVYIIINSRIKIMLALGNNNNNKKNTCKLIEHRPIFFAPKKETGHTNSIFPHWTGIVSHFT